MPWYPNLFRHFTIYLLCSKLLHSLLHIHRSKCCFHQHTAHAPHMNPLYTHQYLKHQIIYQSFLHHLSARKLTGCVKYSLCLLQFSIQSVLPTVSFLIQPPYLIKPPLPSKPGITALLPLMSSSPIRSAIAQLLLHVYFPGATLFSNQFITAPLSLLSHLVVIIGIRRY